MADPHIPEYPMRYITQVCYDGTAFGSFLAKSIVLYSLFFFVITSVRYFPFGLFVVFYIATYYEQIWIHTVLSNYFQQLKPNPHCNAGYGLPCLESQIIAYVVTFILFYAYSFRRPMSVGRRIIIIVFAVYIFFALVWTGNYSFLQTFTGAMTGFVSALLNILVIKKFIYPDFDTIRQWRLARWVVYCIGISNVAKELPTQIEGGRRRGDEEQNTIDSERNERWRFL